MAGTIVLIDDLRSFRDGRFALTARTSVEALEMLDGLRHTVIDQLWLDHDLGDADTVGPVVEMLQLAAFEGAPFRVASIVIHTANAAAADWMRVGLERFGYTTVRRSTDELISAPAPQ